MTVVGVDDTDSREHGMCTTYVGAQIASRLDGVTRRLLVRLNPAVAHKTRGNAAVAIHTDAPAETAAAVARETIEELAVTADERTNPGLVVADGDPEAVPDEVATFCLDAIRDHHTIADAEALVDRAGYRSWGAGNGRGRIGALAAVGAWRALSAWTCEWIAYREADRVGTDREVDRDSVFRAAEAAYPAVWDTVDRGADEVVCVPRTPGPVLYGIRGDDADAVRRVAEAIESEPVAEAHTFLTNQGTDVHLREGRLGDVRDGRAYRLDGVVATDPETRRGGHVFVTIEDADESLPCVAFEPTKRFRDHVRALRPGDRLTVCGEVSQGTCKLEKFAVRALVREKRVTPTCPDCERTMESAGRDAGYRCRACRTTAAGKALVPVERDLEEGWYEVPPRARRHISKPLVRGGFDAPTHPEW